MGRQGSVGTPLHAGIQGAINRLFERFVHVTLLVGSTDLGIPFLVVGSKTHKSCQDFNTSLGSGLAVRTQLAHRIGPSARHVGSTIDLFAPEGNEHDS